MGIITRTIAGRGSGNRPKDRYVSGAESGVDSGTGGDQNKKANDFGVISWSEWQDLNLRPLRPERSALPG
jgi:hypothetical protein